MPRRATLVPDAPAGGTVHMLLDDFSRARAWREMDEEHTDERDIVSEIIDGEFNRPIKIVAFNLEENWVRYVTEDIARAVIETATAERQQLSRAAAEFVARATGKDVPADRITVSLLRRSKRLGTPSECTGYRGGGDQWIRIRFTS